MASPFVFAPAQLEDLDRLVAIEQQSFTAPWTRRMFEAEFQNPFSRLLAARLTSEGRPGFIVGYLCWWVVFEEVRLMNLAVEAGRRRQGIAKALVLQALSAAQTEGAERAVLEVRASNLPAVRLYEELGFRHVAVRAQYYTDPIEDAVLMQRNSVRVLTLSQEVKHAD
ncbi:MAG: ribosomal protein S18-alanine N-acetyltransferase [Nitrospirota bacterium]|nr:ribosomal protein S18-alanine N-acetyltransferase [Nitrospirota bacterium]MDE3117412.1 ribosomal protein S18-alanine N-acetyltransferase [Nitrospirota bacterium]MDE3244242.1 ribosomal protein S18-alanine N-acetyltransferase [Nitrospirota bacterium]